MPMLDGNKVAPWIQTLEGRAFDFDNIDANYFDAGEVATVLSRVPRFAGHSKWFYSVAQHSVHVSRRFEDCEDRLYGLLHDAPEAYIGDVSAPLKYYLRGRDETALLMLEARIWQWIARQHDLSMVLPDGVKHEDLAALATEARDLMATHPRPWVRLPEPWSTRIEPWSQEYSRAAWLSVYEDLV